VRSIQRNRLEANIPKPYNDAMVIKCVADAVVREGKLLLSDLPVADGQHVRVVVTDVLDAGRQSIESVRNVLRGSVERFDDPFEPMLPLESWEMHK